MPGSKIGFAHLTRFIRRLRGGSQPILAEASDGETYVVKFTDNLQGPHLPFNESAGSELYASCGLPVAPWAPLLLTGPFVDQNPECWLETAAGLRKPAAGLCFGSRFLGADRGELYEILPGSYFQRVANAGDFWLAWLLDACAGHSDSRQAIFRETPSRNLDAVFIDFGHMFGGPKGDQSPRLWASAYRDERIYRSPDRRFLLTARRIADSLDTDRLWRRVAAIPDEWRNPAAVRQFAACLDRLADPGFVNSTLEAMVKFHPSDARETTFQPCITESALSLLRLGIQARRRIGSAVA